MPMIALLIAVSAARACDSRTLLGDVRDAEQAFAGIDGSAFDAAAREADRDLACQTGAVTPIESAAYHRVRALTAFLDEDMPSTILSFQASLSAMPGYELPASVAPPGHPLQEQFAQAARMLAAGGTMELPVPRSGWTTIDGTRTRIAPASRPFVFQRMDDEGGVLETRYVEPGDPLPSYAVDSPARAPTPLPVGGGAKVQPGWLAAGGALGVVAGGLYGGAFATRSAYDRAVEDGDRPRILSSRTTTNGLVVGSLGALGLGTTFVLVGVF